MKLRITFTSGKNVEYSLNSSLEEVISRIKDSDTIFYLTREFAIFKDKIETVQDISNE